MQPEVTMAGGCADECGMCVSWAQLKSLKCKRADIVRFVDRNMHAFTKISGLWAFDLRDRKSVV